MRFRKKAAEFRPDHELTKDDWRAIYVVYRLFREVLRHGKSALTKFKGTLTVSPKAWEAAIVEAYAIDGTRAFL